MNNTMSTGLKKRTFTDTVITCIFCAAALAVSVWQLISFLIGRVPQYLSNAAYSFSIFAELGLLSLILLEIRKTGVPFSKKIITKLRIMAVIMIVTGIVPSYHMMRVTETNTDIYVTFDSKNLLIMVVGVVIGILSEVFVYGYELQQDNDSIA